MKKYFLALVATFTLAFGMITVPVTASGPSNTTVVGQQASEAAADRGGVYLTLKNGSPLNASYKQLGGSWWTLYPGAREANVFAFRIPYGTQVLWRYLGTPYSNTKSKCFELNGCAVPLYADAVILSVVRI